MREKTVLEMIMAGTAGDKTVKDFVNNLDPDQVRMYYELEIGNAYPNNTFLKYLSIRMRKLKLIKLNGK